jgi:Tol biopolymer transport system component
VWTPDGRRIAISSSQGVVQPTLFWIATEGGQPAARLSDDGGVQFPGSWAADGPRLAYAEWRDGSDSGWDIRILDLKNRPAHSPLVATPSNEDTPMISPDGRALAYVSDESGRLQVYLRPFTGEGARIQVSTDGGAEPVWSRSGGELFFKNGRRMLAVRVQTQGKLAVGPPTVLFEGDFVVASLIPGTPSYDVAPDGRFLMVARSGEQQLPAQLEVVLNWVADVGRRASQRTP